MGLRRASAVLAAVLTAVLLIDAAAIAYSVLRGPFPAVVPLGSPAAYVNVYLHVPLAITSYTLYAGGFLASLLYLIRRSELLDRLAVSFISVATVYGLLTLLTGSAWAAESWGSPWNWDPRETGVLILFLAYLAYFALRRSVRDPERAPVVSAAYAVAAFALVPVSYAAPYIAGGSLHPTMAMAGGFFTRGLAGALFSARMALTLLSGAGFAVLFALRPSSRWAKSVFAAALLAAAVSVVVGATTLAASTSAARVVDARVSDGVLTLSLERGGTVVEASYSLSRGYPLKPLVVEVGGREVVTLLGHYVHYEPPSGGELVELEVVKPPCVGFSALAYGVALAGLGLALARKSLAGGLQA